MIDVTIIIAAWRAAETLERSVASALGQEDGQEIARIEILIVDDCSSDETLAEAKRLATADSRISVLAQTENRGPAAARNRALEVARGDWIAVLDADDAMAPGRLARMLRFARAHEADIVLDNLLEADAVGAPRTEIPYLAGPAHAHPANWDLETFVAGNSGRAGAVSLGYLKPLIRRSFLIRHGIRYDERLRNSEDYHLILACLAAGASLWFDPAPGYLYTRRAGSISHRADPEHVAALLLADAEFLARDGVWLTPNLRALLARRQESIANANAAEIVMQAMKRARIGAALGALAERPQALGRVARQLAEAAGNRLGLRRG